MSKLSALAAQTEVTVLVAFADLTGFAKQATRVTDGELAAAVDAFYELVAARIEGAGGDVVKFIGDAALVVFAAEDAGAGVAALLALADEADAFFAARGWDCRMHVKAHLGAVVAGPFGGAGAKRFDVIGRNVNAAAMLDTTGVALSAEAFAALSPALQARFRAHAGPVTYARTEDVPRFRRR